MFDIYNSGGSKLARRLKKGAAVAAITYAAATQAAYTWNDVKNYLHPSALRVAFKDEFGFPIKGFYGDIEAKPEDIMHMADVFYSEMKAKPFNLRYVRVEPDSALRNDPLTQIIRLITAGYSGYAEPFTDTVAVRASASRDVHRHEIKHAKTFEMLEQHSEFREEWKKLAVDKDGNSLYLNAAENVFYWLKGLNKLVSKEKTQNSAENEKLGFVSDYARTNFYEDAAEVAEAAGDEMYFAGRFKAWLYADPNPVIKAKVQLAEKYGMIPKEFSEYVRLATQEDDIFPERFSFDHKKAGEFLKATEEFFGRHKNSLYEGNLRRVRAVIFRKFSQSYNMDEEENRKKESEEYYKVLSLPQKGGEYTLALLNLEERYKSMWTLSNQREYLELSEIYGHAHEEYYRRFKTGDISVLRTGVDDFLRANGIGIQYQSK